MQHFLESIGLWYAMKLLFTITLGETVLKPFVRNYIKPLVDAAVEDIRDYPRVFHYLSNHEGKSVGCLLCQALPAPVDSVDTIR